MTHTNSQQNSVKPAIIVHGGSWSIPDSLREGHLVGVINAVKRGYQLLQQQGSALDAVENAVVCMEDNPIFDAGIGSFLNEEGHVELDALIMDGSRLKSGAIGAVQNCKNPIIVARKLLENSDTMMLVGSGANKFAKAMNLACDPENLIIPRELDRWKQGREDIFTPGGTVGAIALDTKGKLAMASSTGGSQYKMVGRLGDTPLIGCGGYASAVAAATTTGHGESFMKITASKMAVDLIEDGRAPQAAAKEVIEKIRSINGYGGIIIIDNIGRIGYSFNTSRMAYALISQNGSLESGIDPK